MRRRSKWKCVKCNKELQTLCNEEQNINGGSFFIVGGGFGSAHDLDSFDGAICDECISKLISRKTIRPHIKRRRVIIE
jgi:hypothetical protein